MLTVETQEEVDRLWSALIADGGEESQCGWCRDRFGLSWQVIPQRLNELLAGPHAEAVTKELMVQTKLDIARLEAAAG
jgi:predicted 3-demethylubiquinone-9 3-methyltransferase (glyoxalase superfamily)